MIGTFSPQAEPYTHEMPEETTPSGLFARGTYSARTKVLFSFIYNYDAYFLILML
jgi:Rho GDP-dissociation inhibitor